MRCLAVCVRIVSFSSTASAQIIADSSLASDEWRRGTNQRGIHGLFPANYVEELRPLVRGVYAMRVFTTRAKFAVRALFDYNSALQGHLPLVCGESYIVCKCVSTGARWKNCCLGF